MRKCFVLSSRWRKTHFLIAALIFLLFSILIFPQPISALDLPFYEDFSSGYLSNWTTYAPHGDWEIVGEELVGSAQDNPKVFSYALAGDYTWKNYSFQTDIEGINTVDKIIMFYFQNDGSTYAINMRSLYAINNGNDILLQKRVGYTGDPVTISSINFLNYINTTYTIKVDVNNIESDVQIDVFVNGVLKIHYIDKGSNFKNGKIGLGVWPENTEENHFDNIKVLNLEIPSSTETPTPTPTPTATPTETPTPTPTESPFPYINVPDIKQFSTPWSSQEYDQATKWSLKPTIERWGCALTSAAMILRNFNHKVFPDFLNNWLKSQSDGYIRNGLINWLAVSRFSKTNTQKIDENQDLPTLNYERVETSDKSKIEEILNQNIPPIIKVPGHFLVATGKLSGEFTVNDPASLKTLLSQIEAERGNFTTINKFTPTHTDLSYLMFIIDNVFDLEMTKLDGTKIGKLFTDDPIKDDVDSFNLEASETLKTFLLPKPEETFYILIVKGTGSYQLDSYLYDKEGRVSTQTIKSSIIGNSPDNFLVVISKDTQGISPVTFKSLIEDVNKAWGERKIFSRTLYRLIKNYLSSANNFYSHGKTKLAKIQLSFVYNLIRFSLPYHINPTASKFLLTKTLILYRSI